MWQGHFYVLHIFFPEEFLWVIYFSWVFFPSLFSCQKCTWLGFFSPTSLFFPIGNAVWEVKFCFNTLIFSIKRPHPWLAALPRRRVSVVLVPCRGSRESPAVLGEGEAGHAALGCLAAQILWTALPRETGEVSNNLPRRQLASQGKHDFTDLKKILLGKCCPGNFDVCLFYFVLE